MCLKSVILTVLVYAILQPEEMFAADETEFGQSISELIMQYHIDNATEKGNVSETCNLPLERNMGESFVKSKIYQDFLLKDNDGEEFQCKNLCLRVNYEIEEIVFNENDTHKETEDELNRLGILDKDKKTNDQSVTDGVIVNGHIPDMTVKATPVDTNIGDSSTTETYNSNTEEISTTENNLGVTDTAVTEAAMTQEKDDRGKKTAIIAGATTAAVAGTAVGSFFIYKWVQTLLQSGTYMFPV